MGLCLVLELNDEKVIELKVSQGITERSLTHGTFLPCKIKAQ